MTDAPDTIDVLITRLGNMFMCSDGSPLKGDGHDRHIQYRRSDLPVRVLPLVWDDRGYDWSMWSVGSSGFGPYQIRCVGEIGWLVDFDCVTIGDPHKTLELAQAAAQADHDARIRSALEE